MDKDGGDDDQRLTAFWRLGFGESSSTAASGAMGYAGEAVLGTDTGYNHNRILTAVMEKPDYLPANVLAASPSSLPVCEDVVPSFYADNELFVAVYVPGGYPSIQVELNSTSSLLPDNITVTSSKDGTSYVLPADYIYSDYRRYYKIEYDTLDGRNDQLDASFDLGTTVTISTGACTLSTIVAYYYDTDRLDIYD